MKTPFNRRRFVGLLAAGSAGSALLVACGNATEASQPGAVVAAMPTPTTAPNSTNTIPTAPTATMPQATPTVTPKPAVNLPNKGQAPDFNNTNWLNTVPLTLASLRGTVVMMEFWTFECINCQNVLPYIKQMYADYKAKGFTIVSMHDPEFETEKNWDNVKDAVKRYGIEYPVAQDNDFATWSKYKINAWPTWVLVDKQGNIRYQHIGEGAYDETRAAIEALLAEPS